MYIMATSHFLYHYFVYDKEAGFIKVIFDYNRIFLLNVRYKFIFKEC